MLNAKIISTCKDAKWAVFFHGFGGSADTWQKQIEEYGKHYNLMLFNFHQRGEKSEPLTVEDICAQIAETMKNYNVESAHIVSLSSGSLTAVAFASLYPDRVLSMVMAGGILSFNVRTNFLLAMARLLRNFCSYMNLYKFFAFIILPRKNHKKSRLIFVQEAKKLGVEEFCRWLNFIQQLKKNKPFISRLNCLSRKIPMLYIMGSEDHLFKNSIIKDTAHMAYASVKIIPGCGHVCCIEGAEAFNQISLEFLRKADENNESNN